MIQINREELVRLSWDILQFILLGPLTNQALLVYLAVGYLAVGVVLGKVHGIGNAARSSVFVGLFTAFLGIFALIQIAALGKMYVLPLLDATANSTVAWIALIVTAFFLLIIPFTRACFQAGYWTSCGAWLCALLVGALAIFGTRSAYNPKPHTDEEAVTNFDTFARGVQKELKQQVDQSLEQFKQPAP
jgi:hypothetical protein